jgi:teichuronic acid biosynthesis glycosyltransferase TuaC
MDSSYMTTKLLTWEYRDLKPTALFITNMWPDAERPVYGIFVKRQIDSLRAQGLRCDVLYIRGYRGLHAYLVAVYRMILKRRSWSQRYRFVHVHAGETALAASALRGMPMLASYCGDDILGYARIDGAIPLHSRLRRLAIQRQARIFTATITKSREMAQALPVGQQATNHVVPNGVNENLFRPMPQAEARQRLGWSSTEQIVLFAATRPQEVRKRFDLAQAVVQHAEAEVGSIRLAVAENQPPNSIPIMMNAADCLLLTSMIEGSPNVVKEAIMCNLPVVTTEVGDVREMLADITPSAVCRHDSSELGKALVDVLKAGIRSNGRQQRADLAESIIARRILEIYASMGFAPDTELPTPALMMS